MKKIEKESFLSRNRISDTDWSAAKIDWVVLEDIHADYVSKVLYLEDIASFIVKTIQAFNGVHSVRWRVKSPEHLLEKIIRKRAEENPSAKYMSISVDNYQSVVSDLVGVRALHLFKEDCLIIHDQVIDFWELMEDPVCYIREGDQSEVIQALSERDVSSKPHPAGYRSVHYVLQTKPGLRDVLIEFQVRTIFEEGWSEVDHKVKYPNFSNDPIVTSFLMTFNRLAGSADEMASFVKTLSEHIAITQSEIKSLSQERDASVMELDAQLRKISSSKEKQAGVDLSEVMNTVERIKEANKSVSDLESRWRSANLTGSVDVGSTIENIRSYAISQNVGIGDAISKINREHFDRLEKLKAYTLLNKSPNSKKKNED
ncbi:RelA/SpoT domain-containing protein [Pseudomonas rhizosphaerae]|uniref:RelA/SpoT domain-containing protein n=1 Tax=Pseudomonas rhizosphaerae TaxID=216142 RepID=UPI002B48376B|nr:hypothetical protein [Pseudomonas rhizosphaerae]MEB2870354.1 hypothetical protein [Pseudomonas rhizosphaerae]